MLIVHLLPDGSKHLVEAEEPPAATEGSSRTHYEVSAHESTRPDPGVQPTD